jgi:hypothetical protein
MKSNLKFAEMPSFNSNETLIRESKNLRVKSGLGAGKNKKTVEIYLPVPK